MSPQLEALAMLNNMFESHDGRPVDNAVLTRADYGFLIRALTDKPTSETPKTEARPVTMAGFVPIPENTPYMNALLKGEQIERERDEARATLALVVSSLEACVAGCKRLDAKLAAARPGKDALIAVNFVIENVSSVNVAAIYCAAELLRIHEATKP